MKANVQQRFEQPVDSACNWSDTFDIVVIGGGAAGIGVTASLLRRRPSLRIAIVEPNDKHYYQPAWTLVGGGAFDVAKTVQAMSLVIPKGVTGFKQQRLVSILTPILFNWMVAVLSATSN